MTRARHGTAPLNQASRPGDPRRSRRQIDHQVRRIELCGGFDAADWWTTTGLDATTGWTTTGFTDGKFGVRLKAIGTCATLLWITSRSG